LKNKVARSVGIIAKLTHFTLLH